MTWNKVQGALNRNGRCGGRSIGNKYSALLKGLVRCGTCDVGMVHTYVNKKDKLYRYYVCVKAQQRGWAQCETRSVSAPDLENAVLEQLRGIARNPALLSEVLRQLNDQRQGNSAEIVRERTDIDRELKKIAQEMKVNVSMVCKAGPSAGLATDRMAELQDRVSHLNSRLAELHQQADTIEAEIVDTQDVEEALSEFDALWEQLSTWEQERFIRTLVEHVRYDGKTGINALFVALWAEKTGPGTFAVHQFSPEWDVPLRILSVGTTGGTVTMSPTLNPLTGGIEGVWTIDDGVTTALNVAAMAWHQDFFTRLASRGMTAATSISMELVNPPEGAGSVYVARFADGSPVATSTGFSNLVSNHCSFTAKTQALQAKALREIVGLQASSGLTPWLQFGEFLWCFTPKRRST